VCVNADAEGEIMKIVINLNRGFNNVVAGATILILTFALLVCFVFADGGESPARWFWFYGTMPTFIVGLGFLIYGIVEMTTRD
jgi:hypothetical protein